MQNRQMRMKWMKPIWVLCTFCVLSSFHSNKIKQPQVQLIILGTLQDGGSPHAGCKKNCCKNLFNFPDPGRKVVSLGIVDPIHQQTFLLEATPDLPVQMKLLKKYAAPDNNETPDGIFLTHAHIGHYSGLMYLGKEAMNANEVPVYVMPRMASYLKNNGPWSQLVSLKNIVIREMQNEQSLVLNASLKITPILVPHRDEYSETVGFLIEGPSKKALFIPDIDKWEKWNKNIMQLIPQVDYAFLDATFFSTTELNNRNMNEIPHPLVVESLHKFDSLSALDKNKIYFIHFNHTNPLLNMESKATQQVLKQGFHLAKINAEFVL